MGFDYDAASQALSSCGGSLEAALESMLAGATATPPPKASGPATPRLKGLSRQPLTPLSPNVLASDTPPRSSYRLSLAKGKAAARNWADGYDSDGDTQNEESEESEEMSTCMLAALAAVKASRKPVTSFDRSMAKIMDAILSDSDDDDSTVRHTSATAAATVHTVDNNSGLSQPSQYDGGAGHGADFARKTRDGGMAAAAPATTGGGDNNDAGSDAGASLEAWNEDVGTAAEPAFGAGGKRQQRRPAAFLDLNASSDTSFSEVEVIPDSQEGCDSFVYTAAAGELGPETGAAAGACSPLKLTSSSSFKATICSNGDRSANNCESVVATAVASAGPAMPASTGAGWPVHDNAVTIRVMSFLDPVERSVAARVCRPFRAAALVATAAAARAERDLVHCGGAVLADSISDLELFAHIAAANGELTALDLGLAEDLVTCDKLSAHGLADALGRLGGLRGVDLSWRWSVDSSVVAALQSSPVEQLSLAGCSRFSAASLDSLLAAVRPSLTDLNLSHCALSDIDPALAAVCKRGRSITRLNISATSPTIDTLYSLAAGLPRLKHINVTEVTRTCDDWLARLLAGHPHLETLAAAFTPLVCGPGSLANAQSLTSLNFSRCGDFSGEGLVELSESGGCTGLKTLSLYGCKAVHEAHLMAILGGCSGANLRSLNIGAVWAKGPEATDEVLEWMGSGEWMGTESSDPVDFGSLASLNLGGSKSYSDAGLIHVLCGPNSPKFLQTLDLRGSPITDVGLDAVASRLCHIQNLSLENCKGLTAEGFVALAPAVGQVKTLNLSQTSIQGDGCDTLGAHLSQLTVLRMNKCRAASDVDIARLLRSSIHLIHLEAMQTAAGAATMTVLAETAADSVKFINMANTAFDSSSAVAFAYGEFPACKELILCGCSNVDDEVVESIAAAGRNLEVVVLDGTGVGEAGIVCLLTRASGSLRHVSAIDCSNIGEEARAELTAAAGVGGSSITSLLL